MRVISFLQHAVFALSSMAAAHAVFGGLGAFSQEANTSADPVPAAAIRMTAPVQVPAAIQPAAAEPLQSGAVPAIPASLPAAQSWHPAVSVTHAGTAPAAKKPASPASKTGMKKANARDLFGAVKEPANLAAKSIGFYAHGCLAGGKPLPVNGPAWQVMRVSRNRNWGHPSLIAYIERFAADAKEKDGWPGLLVGDLSMPRGGPMPYGHASHQVGLDVDIWYKPAPGRELTAKEREDIPMESFLSDPGHVNPAVWSPDYEKLLRRAVSYPEVARIFVNPAIKKWLCDNVAGDRRFLTKISPIMGHDDHFHVRLVCPKDNPGCENQTTIHTDEGCGKGLDKWIESLMKVKPAGPAPVRKAVGRYMAWKKKPVNGRPPLSMGALPAECETVLKAAPAMAAPVSAAR